MRGGDGANDGQSQAVATGAVAGGGGAALERFEEGVDHLWGDDGAAVFDVEDDIRAFGVDAEARPAALTVVADRVFDQVADQPPEQGAVAIDDALAEIEIEF